VTAFTNEVQLTRGRLRPALGLGIAGLALLAIALSGLDPVPAALASFLTLSVSISFWMRQRCAAVGRITFHPDRTLGLDDDRGRLQAEFVSGPALGLKLDLGSGRARRCILFRDEMDPDSWRRLRAWLRHP